jgi:DnaD/phage-associated family protein
VLEGYFYLHRQLLEKPIWLNSTPEQRTILIIIMALANHRQNSWEWQGEKYNVEPGQFITSLDTILKYCGKKVTIQNVRTALKRFEKLEFLTNKSTKQGRLITIVNWGAYQYNNNETNNQSNCCLTNDQQTPNNQLTPNNNDNNDNNDNKYSRAAAFLEANFCKLLSSSEIQKLYDAVDEHGEDIVKLAIEEAVLSGVKRWNYIQSILDAWRSEDVRTLEQAQEQIKKFRKYGEKNGANNRPNRKDTNTDWGVGDTI